jgi:uncharacterized repeat protein (TIGR03899 family)
MSPLKKIKVSANDLENTNQKHQAEIQQTPHKASVSDASTQRQLLNLIKQFSLEGGLLPANKQLPILERVELYQQATDVRRQKNLETIIQQALAFSSDDEVANKAEADWFSYFVSFAENISNPVMQGLWAKILVGEISRPGSYSFKTLEVFKNMSVIDAKLLAKLCSLSVKDKDNRSMRLISGAYKKPNFASIITGKKEFKIDLAEYGLNYSDLLALAESNIIFLQEAETRPLSKKDNYQFIYNGTPFTLAYKTNDVSLTFYKFTAVGNELAQLIKDSPVKNFLHHINYQLGRLYHVSQ